MSIGDKVRMKTGQGWLPVKVVGVRNEPGSYDINRDGKIYRRNSRDIKKAKEVSTPRASEVVKQNTLVAKGQAKHVGAEQKKGQNKSVTKVNAKPASKPVVAKPAKSTQPQQTHSLVSGRVIKKPARYM